MIGRINLSAVKQSNGVWWSAEDLEEKICSLFPQIEICCFFLEEEKKICAAFAWSCDASSAEEMDRIVGRIYAKFRLDCVVFSESKLPRTFSLKLDRRAIFSKFRESFSFQQRNYEIEEEREERNDTVLFAESILERFFFWSFFSFLSSQL